MRKAVKKKWLKALRSGDYKQGTGTLRSANDTFCCLGVLCDLAVKDGVIPEPTASSDAYLYGKKWMSGAWLPHEVQEWAFTKAERETRQDLMDPVVDRHDLSSWNDNHAYNFNQIADLIEAHE